MLSTISGLIVMVVVASLMYSASLRFKENWKFGVAQALTCGIVCGLVTMLSPKVFPVIAMIFLIAILMLMVYVIFWWRINGSTVKELIIVSLADLMMMLTGQSAAARILDITSIRWIAGVIKVLPTVAFILSVGFFISNMIYWKGFLESDDFDPDAVIEKLEQGKTEYGEIFTKIRRRWEDEKDSTDIYFRDTGSHCADC